MAIWVVEEREKGSRKVWRPSMDGYVNPTKVTGEQDLQEVKGCSDGHELEFRLKRYERA